MKTKAFVIFIILTGTLIISFTTSVVAGTDYEVAIEDGTEIVWTVTIDDEDAQKDCDLDIDEDEGDKHKILIKDSGNSGGIIWIQYDEWDWIKKGEEFKDDADDKKEKGGWNEDPEKVINITFTFFIPMPTEEYLKKCDFSSEIKHDIGQYIEISVKYDDYTQIFLYDSTTGHLAKMRYLNDDDEIVYEEYYRGHEIPGYQLPILIGFLAIFTACVAYVNLKQKKIEF